jgi:hypothetical protein
VLDDDGEDALDEDKDDVLDDGDDEVHHNVGDGHSTSCSDSECHHHHITPTRASSESAPVDPPRAHAVARGVQPSRWGLSCRLRAHRN